MKPIKWCLFPGIMTDAEDNFNWSPSGCDWIEKHLKQPAREIDSEFAPIRTKTKLNSKSEEAARVLESLAPDFRLKVITHSNGGELFSRAVRITPVRIEEAHLVAAACDADFDKNGFNDALVQDRIGKMKLYCSKIDEALFWARISKFLAGWAGYGYGSLGRSGPKNVSSYASIHLSTIWKDYKHSAWWDDENFEDSFEMITGVTP